MPFLNCPLKEEIEFIVKDFMEIEVIKVKNGEDK